MKWYGYLICGVLIVISAFLGIKMGRIYFDKSINAGEGFVNSWTGRSETFNYSQTGLTLTENDEGAFVAKIQTQRVEDFNLAKNEYEVNINDVNCFGSTYGTGKVLTTAHKQFVDMEGNVTDSTLSIRLDFLQDKTTITLTCNDGEAAANCWESYFSAFGFKLKLIKIGG